MNFMRRALGFYSVQAGRRWLAAAACATLFSGCGGDGLDGCPIVCFPEIDTSPTVSWQSPRYTLVTSPTGTEPVTLQAIVKVEAFYLLQTDVVTVEPNASNQNPGPDSSSYAVLLVHADADGAVGQAVVRFTVRIVGDAGSYPKGEFPFTATFKRGEEVVTAATTLVVQ